MKALVTLILVFGFSLSALAAETPNCTASVDSNTRSSKQVGETQVENPISLPAVKVED